MSKNNNNNNNNNNMYTYRKPKDAKEAIKLVEAAGIEVRWDICNQRQLSQSEVYFNAYKPIVFIYKNERLIGAAHNKSNRPTIFDPTDRDVTSTYDKLVLNEINIELKQLELF
jgi:hypothetical protein